MWSQRRGFTWLRGVIPVIRGTINTSRQNKGVCNPNGTILILHFSQITVDAVILNVVALTGEEYRQRLNAQTVFVSACKPQSSNALKEWRRQSVEKTSRNIVLLTKKYKKMIIL